MQELQVKKANDFKCSRSTVQRRCGKEVKKQVHIGWNVESVTKKRGKGVEDGSETCNDGLYTGALRRGQELEVADMER